jgi:hypothetical protein
MFWICLGPHVRDSLDSLEAIGATGRYSDALQARYDCPPHHKVGLWMATSQPRASSGSKPLKILWQRRAGPAYQPKCKSDIYRTCHSKLGSFSADRPPPKVVYDQSISLVWTSLNIWWKKTSWVLFNIHGIRRIPFPWKIFDQSVEMARLVPRHN